MDWKPRIRAAFAAAPLVPDDEVLEELAQHAAAMYEAARAEGETAAAAASRVERQIELWMREAPALTRRPRRMPAVTPPPASLSLPGGLLQDLRYALRLSRRRSGFAVVAVLTMALGIGATTLLFSLTWGVLVNPLPWPNGERIVLLEETRGGSRPRFNSFSNAAYLAWRDGAATVEEMAAWAERTATLSGAGDPERIRVTTASASLFDVLGARPLIGSVFTASQELSNVVVLSESLWRQRFGADAQVPGRVLRLDGEPYTVVGVLPEALAYPDRQARAWVPFRVHPATPNSLSMFDVIALLRPGVTPAQAAAEATARGRFAADGGLTATAIFGSSGPIQISARPLRDALTAEVRQPLIVLLAAVGLLLVTATASVASLELARASTRRREMAIRAAIGAGIARLARQLVVESLLLGLAGGLAGLGLAWLLHRALPALLPADFPRAAELDVTVPVVTFAVTLSILTGMVAGVLPALGVRRVKLAEALTEDGAVPVASGGGARTARLRAALAAGQVAIACVLLAGASLFGRSFLALLHADRGYDPSNVLTARLAFPAYPPERRHEVVDRILTRLAVMPGVREAAFTSELPLTPGGSTAAFTMRPAAAGGAVVSVQASPRIVSPRGFPALGMRIVSGRGFAESDTDGAPPVVVVNRAFARRYLRDAALGATLPMRVGYGEPGTEATVIGVIDDVRYPGASEQARPELYYSFRQMGGTLPVPGVTFLLRTTGDPRAAGPALRDAIRDADADLAPDAIVTMTDRVLTGLARPRLYALLIAGFAVFAVVVAGVGLFGVLSYNVAQRSRELGVRAALGASPADILRMVLGEAVVVTAAGVLVGLGAAAVLTRSLATFLYGVRPYDPWTFTVVPLLVASVSLLACFGPARRAARVDPLQVLRAG